MPVIPMSRQSFFLMLRAEATHTNCMVFGLQTVEDGDLESAIQMNSTK
jgi:hypothetical protein